jgi:glucose-1-phosphate cytidylyltransferase
MKTVILCGGEGTRLREYTQDIPKVLVEIGGKPILWHLMRYYAHFGYNRFILCLGYKGEKIREYFQKHPEPAWQIEMADTGLVTPTGGRVKRIENLIDTETFLLTYGDGLSDVDLNQLLTFHHLKGKMMTLTAVQPFSRYGILHINPGLEVTEFIEKPRLENWINGGFFVCNRQLFDQLGEQDVLEKGPMERLASLRQIAAFHHHDFWQCMDTYKDHVILNDDWKTGGAKWKVWEKK